MIIQTEKNTSFQIGHIQRGIKVKGGSCCTTALEILWLGLVDQVLDRAADQQAKHDQEGKEEHGAWQAAGEYEGTHEDGEGKVD